MYNSPYIPKTHSLNGNILFPMFLYYITGLILFNVIILHELNIYLINIHKHAKEKILPVYTFICQHY